jgi:hypothetical protein
VYSKTSRLTLANLGTRAGSGFLRYVIRKRFTKYLPRYVLKDLLDTLTAARITINGD